MPLIFLLFPKKKKIILLTIFGLATGIKRKISSEEEIGLCEHSQLSNIICNCEIIKLAEGKKKKVKTTI